MKITFNGFMINLRKNIFKWGPIDGAIILLSYPMFSMFEKEKAKYGYCWPEGYAIFYDKKIIWINDMAALMDISEKFTQKYIWDDRKREKFLKEWREITDKLYQIFRKIEKIKLGKISDNQLRKIFDRFSSIYFQYWVPAGTMEFVNFALDKWLQNSLKGKISDKNEFNEAFATLSAPVDLTFYRQEEQDLIKIILLPNVQKERALEKHARKYFWIYNSYLESQVLSKDFFAQELEKIKKEDYQKVYQEIINYKKGTVLQKKDLIKKYSLDKRTQKIIKLLEKFTILQDIRKKDNFLADHYVDVLLKEIAKRKNTTIEEMRYLLPSEISLWLSTRDDKIYKDKLAERSKNPIIFHFDYLKGKRGKILDKNSASKILHELDSTDVKKQANLFQGIVASVGKNKYFRGLVKVITSAKEINKINEGEILVTTMTAPDYVVGMKKAGAVITDEGGMTCHAAIVSRELGVPCIVGTKVATKILRDGDIVEIHGGRGTIKVIKTI